MLQFANLDDVQHVLGAFVPSVAHEIERSTFHAVAVATYTAHPQSSELPGDPFP